VQSIAVTFTETLVCGFGLVLVNSNFTLANTFKGNVLSWLGTFSSCCLYESSDLIVTLDDNVADTGCPK